jgi:Tfp pilus assembly protein PilE
VKLLKNKGITLIEMIAIIVVVGLAIPVLMTSWADVAWKSGRSEALADANFFTQELMEAIKSKRFDEKNATPYTNSNNLGVDSGESSTNNATFDDVDDFINATDSWVTSPAAGYSRWVNVNYVFLNSINSWQSCALPVTCGSITNCTNCTECCYKSVTTSVSRQDNFISNATLTMIIAAN